MYDWSVGFEDIDDSHIYFSPVQGNVIFASAIDGWGFGVKHFAELYAKKLGIKADILRKTLWGDFFLNTKNKRIFKEAQSKGKKPLFVQFVLENLWAVYDAVLIKKDKDVAAKIINALKLKISARDSRHSDPRVHLHAIFAQWLPLSEAVLSMVCEKLPSPFEISVERVERLMCSHGERLDTMPEATQSLKQNFLSCSTSSESPLIIYVSKMFLVDKKSLPEFKQKPLSKEELAQQHEFARLRHAERLRVHPGHRTEEARTECAGEIGVPLQKDPSESKESVNGTVFLAFARVFSGTVRPGQKLFVLGPKHNPKKALKEVITIWWS